LVDDELGAPKVVFIVPHVRALELAPLNFFQVKTPYYCHDVVKGGWRIGVRKLKFKVKYKSSRKLKDDEKE